MLADCSRPRPRFAYRMQAAGRGCSDCTHPIHEILQEQLTGARRDTSSSTSVTPPVLQILLECGPMPNVMAALPNIGGALCSTPQSLADAHY